MATIRCAADLALLALDLGKATFDNAFDSASTVQDLVEDGAAGLVRRAPLVPAPIPAVLDDWVRLARLVRAEFKGTVDRTYRLLQAAVDQDDAEAAAADAPAMPRPGHRRAA